MPELLHHLEKLAVLVFLLGSMLAQGLTLSPQAVAEPLRNRRLVLAALAVNFLFGPAFAWLLTALIPLGRGYATGLLLLGVAAGAPFLPKLVEVARGELSAATALMCLLTAGTILALPFALPLIDPSLPLSPW